MKEYGSTAGLVESDHSESEQSRISAKTCDKKAKGSTKKECSSSLPYCLVVSIVLSNAFVLAMVVIGAVYITHLQQHVNHLEQQFEEFKRGDKQPHNETKPSAEDVSTFRSRRSLQRAYVEESAHTRFEHHGISRRNIALLYGDPAAIATSSNSSGNSSHLFFLTERMPSLKRSCSALYARHDGDLWCPAKNSMVSGRYMAFGGRRQYDYFAKASWMNNRHSIDASYKITADGRIGVANAGIYIIQASVTFINVLRSDNPHYGVYKRDMYGNSETLISRCVISPPPISREQGATCPCQTWQLTHLNAGDTVFMKISSYVWFLVDKETLHIALIKLTGR